MALFFPNVPLVPGVPAIPRASNFVNAAVTLLVQDALSILLFPGIQQWGLFLDGVPAITAESVAAFAFKKGASISDFPVEEGSFETYNKVRRPFDVRLRYTTGGTVADRQELLASIDAACDSLDLYDAVTPEAVYTNVNPIHYDYRRTAMSGVGLLVVDVFCEQVRVTATTSFTSTASGSTTSTAAAGSTASIPGPGGVTTAPISAPQSPSAALQINDGTVQPSVPTAAQAAAIEKVLSQSMLPF